MLKADIDTSNLRLERIFIDTKITKSNIGSILSAILPTFQANWDKCEKMMSLYNGELENLIVDSTSKYNEKRTPNLINNCIELKAGMMLYQNILLQTSSDNEKIKADVEIIKTYTEQIGDHKIEVDTLIEMLVCGVSFSFILPSQRKKTVPIIKGNFEPTNTAFAQSNDVDKPIVLTVHRAVITNINNEGNLESVTQYTCFTDKECFILEQGTDKLSLKDNFKHNQPNNPIVVREINSAMYSLFQKLLPIQISYMLTASNLDNDILKKINALLVFIGVDVDPEKLKKLYDKESNTIIIPLDNQAAGQPRDVKYIYSAANMSDLMTHKQNLVAEAYQMAFLPFDNGGRGETGKALLLQNNFVVSDVMANFLELALKKPKMEEIENLIALMKRKKMLTSEIEISDIELVFDHNRLLDMAQIANMIEQLTRADVPMEKILQMCGYTGNVVKFVADYKKNKILRDKVKAILDDKVLGLDEKLAKIDEVNNGGNAQ